MCRRLLCGAHNIGLILHIELTLSESVVQSKALKNTGKFLSLPEAILTESDGKGSFVEKLVRTLLETLNAIFIVLRSGRN